MGPASRYSDDTNMKYLYVCVLCSVRTISVLFKRKLSFEMLAILSESHPFRWLNLIIPLAAKVNGMFGFPSNSLGNVLSFKDGGGKAGMGEAVKMPMVDKQPSTSAMPSQFNVWTQGGERDRRDARAVQSDRCCW